MDAITLSYKKRSCCWTKSHVIASFTFPRKNWMQLFPEDMLRNNAAEVAKVNIDKLMKKDGSIPVKVNCLAGGVSVFKTEMTLVNFRSRLKYIEVGGKALLSFSLAGRRLEGSGAVGHAFTALFCNGKWFGDGSARPRLEPPHHPDPFSRELKEEEVLTEDEYSPEAVKKTKEWEEFVRNTYTDVWEDKISPELEEGEILLEDKYSPEAVKKAKEWEKFVTNTYIDVWEDEISAEMDPPHQEVKERTVSEENRNPSLTNDDNEEEMMDEENPSLDIDSGEILERGSLWDLVADCAGMVALVLMIYLAWIEYNKYW